MNLNLADTIKRLRREKGITQEDVASALGVSFQAVSRWETAQSYPDIELLPHLAALFGVSMDTLFGMDGQNRWEKIKEYCKKQTDDTDANIELTQAYMNKFPAEPYFKYRLMVYYRLKGLDFVKPRLDMMRRLCRFVTESVTNYEEEWIRSNAVAEMIAVEDDENVHEWLKLLDNRAEITSERAMIERYFYRNEVEKYNVAIQKDIVEHLTYIFERDFCKRSRETYKDAHSRAQGQKAILKVIDVFRDPATDVDAWLEERAFAYIRLAGGEFGSGNRDAGYEALERACDLYILYATLPTGTMLTYHCASLDELAIQKTRSCKEILEDAHMFLTVEKGWEWFNSVRKEERFQAQIKRLEVYLENE